MVSSGLHVGNQGRLGKNFQSVHTFWAKTSILPVELQFVSGPKALPKDSPAPTLARGFCMGKVSTAGIPLVLVYLS